MNKKKFLITSILVAVFAFGLITGLVASLMPNIVSAIDYNDGISEPTFYEASLSQKFQNCKENYTGGDEVYIHSNFKYGGTKIVKLETSTERSEVDGITRIYYVTDDTFTFKLGALYSIKNQEKIKNGYYMSNDSQTKVLGRNLESRLGNGCIFIEKSYDGITYNDVFEPLKGEPFQNAGASFNPNIGLYTLSGDDLNRGVKIRVTFCYQLYQIDTISIPPHSSKPIRNYYRFKEIYEFYVVKDTNNVQIVSEDKEDNSNQEDLTDDEKLMQEFGASLGNHSTVNTGFSLQFRTIQTNDLIKSRIVENASTTTSNQSLKTYSYNRIRIEYNYKDILSYDIRYCLLDYNSIINFDSTLLFYEDNKISVDRTNKVINEETNETAEYAKFTFTAKGKHEFTITSVSGKSKKITIYVYDQETAGDGFKLYFDENIFEGERVNYFASIPTFRNSVKIKIKAVDSTLYPQLFIREYFNNTTEPKVYSANQKGDTLEFTEQGNYVLIATNGNEESGGSFYRYTIRFNIDNNACPPQVNKNIIQELHDFSMIGEEVYEIKFKTESGYFAKIIFGLKDFDLAVDYAYELEKLKIENHSIEGYYIYNETRYEDAIKLTNDLRKNAENQVKIVKFDYGFKYEDETIKSLLDHGADIRTLPLQKDTYVMTPSAFDNLFTENIILKGDFQFTYCADYDSQTIVAKHISSGKITDISYGKPLREQLEANGLYQITETNCYNETTTYLINYYDSCNINLLYENGVIDENNIINGTNSITLKGLEVEGNINCFIKLTDKINKKSTIYSFEEFKDIELGVGDYEIYCATQFGGTCTFNVLVLKKTENQTLIGKISNTISNFTSSVTNAFNSAIDSIGNIFDSAVKKVRDFFKGLF